VKTLGLVLFFATVGFFASCIGIDVLWRGGGHGIVLGVMIAAMVGIPIGTVAGGLFGYIVAQKLWG
jgi:hypothetical protein